MPEPYRIGIAGLGTVGTGVVRILQDNGELIARRAGRPVEITAVSARSRDKDRGVDLSSYAWADDPQEFVTRNDCDAVVELIGGEDGPAKALVEAALGRGKAVVTANKALLAHHGLALAGLAEENQAALAYEAAVAGGIPVIKALKEGFAGNEIQAVYGILNGTCNYILTEMRESGRPFEDVLKDAQAEGYAEADPGLDIDGIDAGHKLAILTALAFGVRPAFAQMRIQGIRHLTADDISFADELGYRIKLLGIARRFDGRLIQMVEPCLVPQDGSLGSVDGVFNAVFTEGDHVGKNVSIGRGAGAGPTASAVVGDIIDLARGFKTPVFGVPANDLSKPVWADEGDLISRFYLRLTVLDKPGVLADVSAILRDHNVSIEVLLQRGRDPEQPVPLVLITHDTRQQDIELACELISGLDVVEEPPCLLRIEQV